MNSTIASSDKTGSSAAAVSSVRFQPITLAATVFFLLFTAGALVELVVLRENAYLWLAILGFAALSTHWIGWILVQQARGLLTGLLPAIFVIAITMIVPVYFFTDYWIVGVLLALLIVLEVCLSRQTQWIPPIGAFTMLSLAAMLGADAWFSSSSLTQPSTLHRLSLLAEIPDNWSLLVGAGVILAGALGLFFLRDQIRHIRLNLAALLALIISGITAASLLIVIAIVFYTGSIKSGGFVGSLVLALVMLLAAEIARRIANPIRSLTTIAATIAQGSLIERAEPSGPTELFALAETINLLTSSFKETLEGLEHRMADRTLDVEQRSKYLEAAAEVARAATSILDPNELSARVVDVIRERFNLYYVGMFLLDETGEWAVLRAGTGDAGQIMLQRHHRINVSEGMIGWCIRNVQARIALEAGQDAVRMATQELPGTRSEAALPLRSRGRVVGALSVQSDQVGFFNDATLIVLQTATDQVATALDNARLFAESNQALETTRLAYGELSRSAWIELIKSQPTLGYLCDDTGVKPIFRASPDSPDSIPETTDSSIRALQSLPIKVRGQTLGTIRAQKARGTKEWSKDEIAMFETITEQLSIALENARLYSDTQRSAEREHIQSEITTKVRASTNVRVILQTAIQELAEALNVSKASIQLRAQTGSSGAPGPLAEIPGREAAIPEKQFPSADDGDHTNG